VKYDENFFSTLWNVATKRLYKTLQKTIYLDKTAVELYNAFIK